MAQVTFKGRTVWTTSRKTGKDHQWEVKSSHIRHDGSILARNVKSGVQRFLKAGEWRINPCD